MRIIKYSLACEVAQNATSTLFSFTKQSNTVVAVSPSLFFLAVVLSFRFLGVSQLSGGSLGVLIVVLSLIKTSVLSQLGCPQVGN